MKVACALISTFAGCGDGLYTPGVGRDASAKRDAATDTESGAFITRLDATVDPSPVDASPPEATVRVGENKVTKVVRGAAVLTFPPLSFSPPADVTIAEISGDGLRVRGHYKPVFELTFKGGTPTHAPDLKIDLRQIVDPEDFPVVGLGKGLVLARYKPASNGNPDQWLKIQQTTLADDGDSIDVTLVKKGLEFTPDQADRMIVAVVADCDAPASACQGSCDVVCMERELKCNMGRLCQ